MLVSCEEMRRAEEAAFASGASADGLMEEAGLRVAEVARQSFPSPGTARIYYGKGHNGGDALVASRHLALMGWRIQLHPAFPPEHLSALTAQKLASVGTSLLPRHTAGPLVILDGLLGIGANGALRDPVRAQAREINELRRSKAGRVIAIDAPTGLNGDTGEADPDCVVADLTAAIGFCKKGLVADPATNFVGRLAVLPLEGLSGHQPGSQEDALVATPESLSPLLPLRAFDSHKGSYGRIGIIAGSRGFVGAALLASEAAVRAGAGLVTLYVTEDIYAIAAAAASPSVMVYPVVSYRELMDRKHDALGIGPGLGQRTREAVLDVVRHATMPMVVDADALNLVSSAIDVLRSCAGPRLLTPHPGEMERLFPRKPLGRKETVDAFTKDFPVTLLLKGSRTIVGEAGRSVCYNTTGAPGMATGGMGDVLTGVCASLIGQGLSLYDAARLAAWLCGRASELAIQQGGRSEESLAAPDLFATLGSAFMQLRQRSVLIQPPRAPVAEGVSRSRRPGKPPGKHRLSDSWLFGKFPAHE